MKLFLRLWLLLSLSGLSVAFELPFGRGRGKLVSMHTGPEDVKLPYSIVVREGFVHVLDPLQRKIIVLNLQGELKTEVDLNIPDLLPWHPLKKIEMSGHRYMLLSGRDAGVLLYDPVLEHVRVMNRSDSAHSQLRYPRLLTRFDDYYTVLDALSGYAQIFSRRGNYLGSIHTPGSHDVLPFSPHEILAIEEDELMSEVSLISMRGDRSSFFRPSLDEGDEFSSLKFIGADEQGFIYLEESSGPRHGTPLVSVLKVSPMGDLVATALTEATSLDMWELEFRFVLVDTNALFQLHLNNSGLGFKPIILKPSLF